MAAEPLRIEDAQLSHHTKAALEALHLHERAEVTALNFAVSCGAHLLEVKRAVGHGGWLKWLAASWPRSADVAEEFMLLANNPDVVTSLPAGTSRRGAAELIREVKRQVRITATRQLQRVVADDAGERWQAEVGDARKLPLEDNSVGCWIGSPPYNARLEYEGYTDWLPWSEWWDGLIVPAITEAARVLRPGGRLCLNLANVVRNNVGNDPQRQRRDLPRGPQDTRPKLRYRDRGGKKWAPPGAGGASWAYLMAPLVWDLMEQVGLLQREQITWVKGSDEANVTTTSTAWGSWGSHSNPVLRAVAEPIFIADKASHTYDRDDVAPDLTRAEQMEWCRNVWFIANEGGTISRWGAHPAPFPVELPRRLAKLYAWPGDLVVDGFMGLGATGEAALRVGRRFYGCDVSEVYVERARRRLDAVSRELATP